MTTIIPLLPMLLGLTPAETSRLLDAIEWVESRGNCNAVGDGGRSLGAYQIQRPYWLDSRVPGKYRHVKVKKYARRVVRAYWKRYGPKNATMEQLARIHVGGPKGHKKKATIKYWQKVRKALNG